MLGHRNRRYDKADHAWCVLLALVATLILAIDLATPARATPAGAMPREMTNRISECFATSHQGADDFSGHAFASHMNFEHHQLIGSEHAIVISAPGPARAFDLTRVNPLASIEPFPLRRPPRA